MKTKQQRYRERLQEAGYRQIAVWLNGDTYALLQRVMTVQQLDAADAIGAAIRCYHNATVDELALAGITKKVASDSSKVTSDVPSDLAPVTSDTAKSSRYMSPPLENHILTLRESGLSLNATARRLADEGHFNAKGELYSTATISKAEVRARIRRAAHPS